MPRQARMDTPGALHPIVARGIEGRKIFHDDEDRDAFIERPSTILDQTATECHAWALIPNRFHRLQRTGSAPIATVMLISRGRPKNPTGLFAKEDGIRTHPMMA